VTGPLVRLLARPGRRLLASVPEGLEAFLLAEAAGEPKAPALLHVCRDDARMARLADAFSFFNHDVEILTFPAWDCLPYDRVSPHRDILARRIATLAHLLRPQRVGAKRLVLTTVGALLQRLPPRDSLRDRWLMARAGEELPVEKLTGFLVANGYQRVETVGEPGEFALRGGILDLFPAGAPQPLRLDFFGDELDTIRPFDPLTQLSSGKQESLALLPFGEVLLEEATIHRFRTGYRASFGATGANDPLYTSVSEGRPHPGMEHWLPLFYDRLETLFDYLPDAAVTLDHQAEEVRQARLESIADFFDARSKLARAESAAGGVYNPLPPDRLYLVGEEWESLFDQRPTVQFTPYDQPPDGALVFSAEGRRPPDFSAARKAADGKLWEAFRAFVRQEQEHDHRVVLAAYTAGSRDRLAHMLDERGVPGLVAVESWAEAQALPVQQIALAVLPLEQGFGYRHLAFLSEQDLLGERIGRAGRARRKADNFLTEVATLSEGDYVVHVDHGIGRYEGLETLSLGDAPHDCLKVVYHGGDRLFVPVENIDVLSRFGSQEGTVELDRLGHGNWQARKARVKERLREAATELIRVAALRELRHAEEVQPPEGIYDEFAARFPYPETDDQLRAIEDVFDDLSSGKPMDRLVCGDVGFGKTEVAMRAAFVVAMSGRQVAVVVPTTLLARQHFKSFEERFSGLPLKVAQLSRLVTGKDAAAVKQGLADGKIDLVVGTHALLANGIRFKDLGLLIVDEEQHFGVKQKERMKQLRAEVHVLTLTATPIPRTLQLAMSGVKEMSLISTPPVDRLAVRTFVMPYDGVVIREAILREYHRGGQIFYVCPRIEDLDDLQERLRTLVPEVKMAVAHGRLSATALEEVMSGFVDRRFDLLLSTNIVESGLDIPTANTLIIHRADMFGLAQLYQLRGRVGRSKLRGYAYLTLPQGKMLSKTAERRLQVMQTLDTLGAGFTLASHDMDIRGAGNLLGEEQSGHVREVGIELYQQMLEDAVAAARAGAGMEEAAASGSWSPQINLGTSVLIPEAYVTDLNVRLGLYRRLAEIEDGKAQEAFAAELVDRFGPLPPEVENLLQVMTIKRLCRQAGVEKLDAGPKGATVSFRENSFSNPLALVRLIDRSKGALKLRPDHKLLCRGHWDEPPQRVRGARALLERLVQASEQAAA